MVGVIVAGDASPVGAAVCSIHPRTQSALGVIQSRFEAEKSLGFVGRASVGHQSMGNGRGAEKEKKNYNTEIARKRDGHWEMW